MNKLLRSCYIFICSLGWISTLLALCGIAESLAAPQSIDWTSPTNGAVLRMNQAHPLTATASSGLPVTFRVANGPAEIGNGMVTATNSGTVVVVAEQAGDAEYSPASLAGTFNQPSVQLTRLGSYRLFTNAPAEDVQVVGKLAYVANDHSGLLILDISDPTAPTRVGSYPTSGAIVYAVDVVGNFAFLAVQGLGLVILDVTDPATPVRVGGYASATAAFDVQVVGNFAYLADWHKGMFILDVSNPKAQLRRVGYFADAKLLRLQVANGLAYLADELGGLQIVDVSNPESPVRVGGYDTSGEALNVQVAGSFAYVADGFGGLQIVDVRDPAAPVRVGSYDTRGSAWAVQVVGNLAFVSDFDSGLQVLDISDRTAPIIVGSFKTGGTARAAVVVGNIVYLADGDAGVKVLGLQMGIPQSLEWNLPTSGAILHVNESYPLTATSSSGLPVTFRLTGGPALISDGKLIATNAGTIGLAAEQVGDATYLPVRETRLFNWSLVHAVRAGSYNSSGSARDVRVVGNLAYVADGTSGLQILDVSNPESPVHVSGYDTDGDAAGLQVMGRYAYVADSGAGLQILDVSNPQVPVLVGGYKTNTPVVSVKVVGSLAYVAADTAGLLILNINDPANLVLVGSYQTFGHTVAVEVVGQLAYLAANNGGLIVLNVANPSAPYRVGAFNTGLSPRSVHVVSDFVYAVSGRVNGSSPGLHILDVHIPAEPVRVGSYGSSDAREVRVDGNFAYLTDEVTGLQIVDISNPAKPVRVGGSDTGGSAQGVEVRDGLAFVAAGDAGLQIVRLHESIKQSLAWSSPTNDALLLPNQPYQLIATANSGLPVTFRVLSGPGMIAADTLTATNVGILRLMAEQVGDEYFAAAQETRTLNRSIVQLARLNSQSQLGTVTALQVVGDLVYTAANGDGLQIWNVGGSAEPVPVGGYPTRSLTLDVQVIGKLAYLADYTDGLQILDVSNPAAPTRVGGYDTVGLSSQVRVVGNLAYVVDGFAGLQILDVTDPTAPRRLGSYEAAKSASSVVVVDDLAYLTDTFLGLLVLNVRNPAAPLQVGYFDGFSGPSEVQLIGTLAYVADGYGGLRILDVSVPAKPVLLGGYMTNGSIGGVQVVGSLAFLVTSDMGLVVVDVSDPSAPKLVSFYESIGISSDLQVVGNRAFAGDRNTGLNTFSFREWIKQTLTWSSPTNGAVLEQNQAYRLQASASSGLPVSFRLVSGPAVIQQDTVTITNIGNVTLIAEQAGNEWIQAVSEYSWATTSSIFTTSRLESFGLVLEWVGGREPFTIMKLDTLEATPVEAGVTYDRAFPVSVGGFGGFYQVRGAP